MHRKVYAYLFATYGQKPGYWIGFAACVGQSLLMRVVAAVVIAGLAAQIAAGDAVGAQRTAFIYLGVAVAGLLLRLVRDTVGTLAENAVYTGLMVDYYSKLVGKDLAFYRDHQTGYLASTFRQHADSAMQLARLVRGEGIQSLISLTLPMTVLLVISWPIGLAALVVVVAQVAYISWTSHLTHPYRKLTHEVYRKISGQVSDDITNIVAFKTSGDAALSRERMSGLAAEEQRAYSRRRNLLALLDTPRDIITVAGTAVAFWLVGSQTGHSAAQSVSLIVLTVTYMFQIFQTVGSLPSLIEQHDDLITKLYPTLDYLGDHYETIRDVSPSRRLQITSGAIELQHVEFSYHSSDGRSVPVFRNLNLSIAGGEQVGVVGLSGAGKSTLASLLLRFDDIDSGTILIDGTDISQVSQTDLRQQIAFVPQEPLLFHRSVRDNIAYFRPQASQAEIEQAARAAHADSFIASLPDGYQTMVGERGVKLSGGQKQRVVLARSILKNAPIMILDEATSALDSQSEKIIQAAMPEILGKRTALVIAHRLSTVASLDRIVVMHDGQISESGTHESLLAHGGRYASLWHKQSRTFEDTGTSR